MDKKRFAAKLLESVRAASPLIHNITNFVVMNSSANILLALGASPVMAHCREEVEEMTTMAGALVLNIGTLQEDWVESMILAAKTANRKKIPVILDPVGAGATSLRTAAVKKIMREVEVAVLRGNASEVFSLASSEVKTRGVDSSLLLSDEIVQAAGQIAIEKNCVVAISGPEDLITDGHRMFRVANGHPMMRRVTGIGCGLSAVTAAFCAVEPGRLLDSTVAAFAVFGMCGELAARTGGLPGSFYVAFIDALYSIGEADINTLLRVGPS